MRSPTNNNNKALDGMDSMGMVMTMGMAGTGGKRGSNASSTDGGLQFPDPKIFGSTSGERDVFDDVSPRASHRDTAPKDSTGLNRW